MCYVKCNIFYTKLNKLDVPSVQDLWFVHNLGYIKTDHQIYYLSPPTHHYVQYNVHAHYPLNNHISLLTISHAMQIFH